MARMKELAFEQASQPAVRKRGELYSWEMDVELEACRARGVRVEKFLTARRFDPSITCRPCAPCATGGAPEPNYAAVRLVFSRTAYSYTNQEKWDRKPDPNGPQPMCSACTETAAEHYNGMWDEYYAECF